MIFIYMLCFLVAIGLTFMVFGQFATGGMRSIKKAAFKNVDNPHFVIGKKTSVIHGIWFREVSVSRWLPWGLPVIYVIVRPEARGKNIKVRLDAALAGTALSVVRTWWDRFCGVYNLCHPKEVTIWVQNEEEKARWEQWARQAEETYFADQENTEPAFGTVIPPL